MRNTMRDPMRNEGISRIRRPGDNTMITSVRRLEDINFNRMDANDLYLMSSEKRCFRINRQEATLSGKIRALLNYPGRENVRVLYFCKINNEQIIKVLMCMRTMSMILKSNNMINLLPRLRHTTEPLQINLQTPVLELQQSIFNHSQHAELIPESVKATLRLRFGIEI